MGKQSKPAQEVKSGEFETELHFYQKTINAQVSSVVHHFMNLGNERIISRYMHLNPNCNRDMLRKLLTYKPKYFKWSGADLFNVTTSQGVRKMVLIETNSCPSGQKSMPVLAEHDDLGGYRDLMEKTFKPWVEEHDNATEPLVPNGRLAVVYDKNVMEASGYAATLADIYGCDQESILLVEYHSEESDPNVRWTEDRVMEVRDGQGVWHPIKACFRYVTQKPWNRLPVNDTKTLVLNPIVCCLAGGRNKLLAAKAYDFLNAELSNTGLKLHVPNTIRDVEKNVVPIWVNTMGGFAVVKNPYSNAGQGVWTITSQEELDEFMKQETGYDQYIVQSLIGNHEWSSMSHSGQFYHVGTVPDRKNNIYVADLRMMVHYNYKTKSFSPLALYARRASKPLVDNPKDMKHSWDILGTNLSVKKENGGWDTDTSRLIIADRKDFNKLGLGVDNLIDAYIQTVLATVAIDKLACRLYDEDGRFNIELFRSLNKDDLLVKEILL